MSVKLNCTPKPDESQKNSNGKTIPYPGFEPGTSGLAVCSYNQGRTDGGMGAPKAIGGYIMTFFFRSGFLAAKFFFGALEKKSHQNLGSQSAAPLLHRLTTHLKLKIITRSKKPFTRYVLHGQSPKIPTQEL
jgi:hypothetical protein